MVFKMCFDNATGNESFLWLVYYKIYYKIHPAVPKCGDLWENTLWTRNYFIQQHCFLCGGLNCINLPCSHLIYFNVNSDFRT